MSYTSKYSGSQIDAILDNVANINVVQTHGDSETAVMSQKAVTSTLLELNDYVGQVITFEDGKYANVGSKTIQNHSYFALSNAIKVIPNSKVTVTSYVDSIVGIALLNGETLLSIVAITDETTKALYSKEIEIPANCDNIRISTVASQKDKVLCVFNNVVKSLIDVATEHIALSPKRILNKAECWDNRTMQNNGQFATSNSRITNVGYISDIDSASCENGYTFRLALYDESKSFLGFWDGTKILSYTTDLTFVNFANIYANTNAKYFKIVLLKTDGSVIKPEECSAINVLFNTSMLEDKLTEKIDNSVVHFSKEVSNDVIFDRDIPLKSCFRASYKFPKDIHSTEGEYELFSIKNANHNLSVRFAKAVTTPWTAIPSAPAPVYNAGFKVYLDDALIGSLIPDGWRKELLLGEDAMSMRFKGDCSVASNQDIRLKVDASNIVIYHSGDNSVIASFTKSNYSTMKNLYEAIKTATESTLSSFEVYALNLENLTPDDIIECDVPLVGQYYADQNEQITRFDAYPYYFTTKQSDKTYDLEVLFNKDKTYPIQILVNGCAIAKIDWSGGYPLNVFISSNRFTVKDNSSVGIITEGIEFDGATDLSKYPDIKVLYVEKIDEGLTSLQNGYSVSQNKVIGWASYLKKQGRTYIGMKDIERVLDGSIKTSRNFLWNFQLDDSSIECVTNANVRNSLLRNNIRPAIAMMLNKSISEEDLKIVKASESAGFEYHIHSCYTDGDISMCYYTYTQLDANITEAIEKFIEVFGSVPTVLGKHAGKGHYSMCRYLKNKGFRVIFADNGADASLNEVTRFACKRNLIQEQLKYTDIRNLDNTY